MKLILTRCAVVMCISTMLALKPSLATANNLQWINGFWKIVSFSEHSNVPTPMGFGQTSEVWKIELYKGRFSIYIVHDYEMGSNYRRFTPLQAGQIGMQSNKLGFTVLIQDGIMNQKTTYRFDINEPNPRVLNGFYQSYDNGFPELPPIKRSGRVTLRKLQ